MATQPGRNAPRKFVYTARPVELIKMRAERKGGQYDSPYKPGFDMWKAKEGDNLIRILPPTWDNPENFGYRVFLHAFVGPDNSTYLCPSRMLNKRCPICAASKEAEAAGEEEDAAKFKATEKNLCWLLDRDANDNIPKLYPMSWTMDRDIASLIYSKRSGEVLLIDHPDEGFDLTIRRTGTTKTNTKYFGLKFDHSPTKIATDPAIYDEIINFINENPIPSILRFHPYEHLEKVISGGVDQPDEDLDQTPEDANQDYNQDTGEVLGTVLGKTQQVKKVVRPVTAQRAPTVERATPKVKPTIKKEPEDEEPAYEDVEEEAAAAAALEEEEAYVEAPEDEEPTTYAPRRGQQQQQPRRPEPATRPNGPRTRARD